MELAIPYFVYLAAGDSEETLWVQLLVILVLAAGGGIYTLSRSRAKHIKRTANDEIIESLISRPSFFVTRQFNQDGRQTKDDGRGKRTTGRDLKSGMELLEREFLVWVVEHIDAADNQDIAMRGMCFAELVRRGELSALLSEALKAYILDEGGFFGKTVQREAMAELAGRTEKELRVKNLE
jgi:hypothetical protein